MAKLTIIWDSVSGKANLLFNLIKQQPDVDQIYLYSKDLFEAKYKFLIKKRERTGWKYLKDSEAFIEYSNDMHDIHKNIEEYNPNEKSEILIVFDDTIADMLSNKELNPTVTELFIRARKLNISLAFIEQSCFPAPKNIRLNSTPYFIMEIPNKQELQQIAFNHLSGNDIRDFMNLYRECTAKSSCLV